MKQYTLRPIIIIIVANNIELYNIRSRLGREENMQWSKDNNMIYDVITGTQLWWTELSLSMQFAVLTHSFLYGGTQYYHEFNHTNFCK